MTLRAIAGWGVLTVLLFWVFGVAPASAGEPLRIGVMLPYTGTYAQLGESITQGLKLAMEEAGGSISGREVEYVVVDDESDPSRAPQNMLKLVSGENVDLVVGTVHSGVAMGMVRVAREEGTLLVIPNAGFNAATRELCAPNIFRTSFSSWQASFPMGQIAYDMGYRKMLTISWNYSFGQESLAAFREGFEAAGGVIVKEILTPFPQVEFQSYLTEIAALKPDAVYTFYSGGGAVKFVKDYAAAGLKENVPLLASGFLTDGLLDAEGEAAEGIVTVLHYADDLDNPADRRFRAAYRERYGEEPDLHSVQGYDTGVLLIEALTAVQGNTGDQAGLIAAMENVELDSPRGKVTFSKAHNPIQDIYLREVKDGANRLIKVAAPALDDPATGCEMAAE